MARKDVPMGKPGQQKRSNSNSQNQEDSRGDKASDKKKDLSSNSSNLRRSNRQRGSEKNDSYLSSDPNFAAFRARLEAIGLELRDILGDGNCLFRALGDQLYGSDCDHLKHREDVVGYMLKHENDFAPFVEDDVPFAKHIEELRQPGTFAGNDAIVAFARLHEVSIIIHQLDAPAIEIKGSNDPAARQLHISYHNGDHYSSVRRINDSTNKPVNIRLTPAVSQNDKKNSPSPLSTGKGSHKAGEDVCSFEVINEIVERTGCEDMELIKSSLESHDHDVASTIDHILAILTFSRPDSVTSSNDGGASDGDVKSMASSGVTKSNQPKSRSQQARVKKAEKKLRRMQERRDQTLISKGLELTSIDRPVRHRTSESPGDSSGQDVVIINSAKLNIVSV